MVQNIYITFSTNADRLEASASLSEIDVKLIHVVRELYRFKHSLEATKMLRDNYKGKYVIWNTKKSYLNTVKPEKPEPEPEPEQPPSPVVESEPFKSRQNLRRDMFRHKR